MPRFLLSAPDGSQYVVNAPEGMSQNDIIRKARAELGFGEETATEEPPRRSASDELADIMKRPVTPDREDIFMPAVRRGGKRLASTVFDILPALGASAIGADEYARQQLAEAKATEEEIQRENPPVFSSYKEVQGPGDILPFGIETLGEQAANIASLITPATAGAKIGSAVALGTARKALLGAAEKRLAAEAAAEVLPRMPAEAATARLAESEAGKRLLERAGAKGAERGALLGTYLGGTAPMGAAEVFQNVEDRTGELAPGAALMTGALVGALDVLSPAKAILAFSRAPGLKAEVAAKLAERKGIQPGLIPFVKDIALASAKGAATEAITEPAQELLSIAAERIVGDIEGRFTPEEIDRVIDSSARALAPGAVFGGVEGVGTRGREMRETQRQEEGIAQREAEAKRVEDEANERTTLEAELPDLEQRIANLQTLVEDPANPTRKSAQVQLETFLDDYNTKSERYRYLTLSPEERAAEEAAQAEEAPGAAPTTVGKPAPAEGSVEAVLAGLGIDRQKALTAIKAFNKEPGVTRETAFSIPLDAPVRGDTAVQLDKFLDRYKATPEEAQAIDELRQTMPELQPENIKTAQEEDRMSHLATAVDLKPKDVGNWYQRALGDVKPGEDAAADEQRWTELTAARDAMKNKSAKMVLDAQIKQSFPALEQAEADRVATLSAEQKKAEEAAKNVAVWSKIADVAKVKQEKAAAKAAAAEAKRGSEEGRQRVAEAIAMAQAQKAETEVPPGVAWTPETLQGIFQKAQKEQAAAQAKAEKQRVKETVAGAVQLGAQSRAKPEFVAKVQQFTPEFLKSRGVYVKSKLGQILTSTPVRSLEDVENIAKQVEEKVDNPKHQQIAEGIINDLRTAMTPKAEVQESRAVEAPIEGATPESVRAGLEKAMGRDVNAVSITRTPEEAGLTGVNPRAKGAVVNGRAHLFTQNIEPGRELGTFLHEVGDHLGMKRMVGEGNYNFLVNKVQEWASGKGDALENKIARAAMARIPEGTKANDEALAYFIEEAVDNFGVKPTEMAKESSPLGNFFRKLLAGIKNVLAKLGVKRDPTAQELVDLAHGAAKLELSTAKPVKLKAPVIQKALPTEEAKKNFAKWFEGSKVVDKSGKPTVLYHGTFADITKFTPSKEGLYGKGIYLTGESNRAAQYATGVSAPGKPKAGNILPVYAALKNPITAQEFRAKFGKVGFAGPQAAQVQNQLIKEGYDGIIDYGFRGENAMPWEVVAFHPEQIKSATGNIGTFDETNPDIRYSIAPDQPTVKKVYDKTFERLGTTIRNTPVWKNDSAKTVLGAMSNLPNNTKKFLYYSAPLYQLADMAETFSPKAAESIRDLEKLLGKRKEKSTERVNAISKLLERNTAKMKKFSAKQIEDFEEIAHELSRLQIDPEDKKFSNEPLYKRFHASPKELKEVFFEVVKKYEADADAFLDAMEKLTEGAFSPEMKVKYKLMVKRIYPYLPLYREGAYWMGYTDAVGEPVIQSFESELDRNMARQDLINSGIKADKIDYFKQLADITPDKMRPTKELASLIKVMEEKKIDPVVRDKAYQMFLQLFPAGSVMQQFKKRQGRKGYRPEMLQNFAVVNSRMADALTQFEYAPNINRVYADLNNELLKRGRSGTDQAIDLLDEMNARGEYLRSPANNYYANLASSLSYNQYLLGNISSSVMNTTGLPMITLPMLGGEYGWSKASGAMRRALSDYMGGGRDDNSTMKSYFTGRSLADKTFMGDKVRAAAEKAPKYSKLYNMKRLYDAALAQQAIHQSVGIDVTGRKKTSAGDYVGRWATIKASLSWLFQNSERMNREVTLLAAFNLELNNLQKDPKLTDEQRVQGAINKAVELVKRTQGPAMTETGGRIFQSDVGKVIGTFKKYPMTQLYLVGDLFNDAFRGADEKTKAVARKQLAGIYGMGMGFVGIKGLPLVGAATFIASLLFGDDDEPFDANQRGLETFGQLGWNGLVNSLTGLRVSDRAAIGQFFRDDPKRLSELGPIWYAAEQIVGPVAGMAKNYQEAYELLNDGRPLKALERAMPLAISNGIKAVDQAVNGVRTKEGARITDDPNLYNLFMQGVGFQSEEKARAGEINSIENQIETAVIARRTKLLADLWRNRADPEALARTNEAIQKFNTSKYGRLYRITPESRIRSRAQYTAKVKAAEQHGGMAPNMKLAPSFRALEEAAGGP